MEEAGVIQNLFSSCDRGMTLHASILGKKFTALLGLDQVQRQQELQVQRVL